jgi:putative nucleotidyltransferase with HDIG domain
MRAAPFQARALRALTILAGGGVIVAAAVEAPYDRWRSLALLLAAVMLAELLQINGGGDDEEAAEPSFSFSSGIHLAAILLLGAWAAVLVAAAGVLAVDRTRGSAASRVAFNAAVFALAAGAGGFVFGLAGGQAGSLSLPGDFVPVALAALAYGAVNAVLVTTIIALWSGVAMLGSLRRSWISAAASSTAEAAVGLLLALCALEEPWAVAAVVPLVVVAYQAHARLAQLRLETARALETFANVIDERDVGTYRHSSRVAELVGGLARDLRLPPEQVERLESAGRLHDLGKISVDASVLRKPGKLDREEWAAMRRHARLSARLLRSFRFAADEATAVEYHHERYDGRGYYGISRDDIPIASHFLMVADTFDAMCSDRPYRRGLSEEAALAEIERNAGGQFHPAVAKAFVAHRRGLDAVAALDPSEYEELRRPVRTRSRTLPALQFELLGLVALAVALASAGVGEAVPAVAAGVVACAALVVHGRRRRNAARLAETLRRELEAAGSAADAFRELNHALGAAASARWSAVVRWSERELTGAVALATGSSERAPGDTALTSWFVREADSRAGLLREQHGGETHVAVPLRAEGSTSGYVVVVFETLPRHVDLALRAVRGDLQRALAPLCAGEASDRLVAAS